MTAGRALRLVQRLVMPAVLVGSGAYMLVYLYRWEWNRALMSGVFFLAAEIALATTLLLRRLAAAGATARPGAAEPPPPTPDVLAHLRQTPVDRPDPFAWLRPGAGPVNVFVPVLLGAGALVSALAYVIDRAAEATAAPGADRRLAGRLDALALPPGGLGGRRPAPLVTPAPPAGRPLLGWLRQGVAPAVVVLAVGLGVYALREAAESRPDRRPLPGATVIQLEIGQRGASSGTGQTVRTAEALWVACRDQAGDADRELTTVQLGTDEALLVITPGVGELGTRRLTGCLSDRTLSLVEARVVAVDHVRRSGG